jgi:hypothetical protein
MGGPPLEWPRPQPNSSTSSAQGGDVPVTQLVDRRGENSSAPEPPVHGWTLHVEHVPDKVCIAIFIGSRARPTLPHFPLAAWHGGGTCSLAPSPTVSWSGFVQRVESSRAWPPHRPRGEGLAHPADPSRTHCRLGSASEAAACQTLRKLGGERPRSRRDAQAGWRQRAHTRVRVDRSRTAMEKSRIVAVGISGGGSLTGPLRDARRFPSTRWFPVPEGYAYAVGVWDLSIIQGPSRAICRAVAKP